MRSFPSYILVLIPSLVTGFTPSVRPSAYAISSALSAKKIETEVDAGGLAKAAVRHQVLGYGSKQVIVS